MEHLTPFVRVLVAGAAVFVLALGCVSEKPNSKPHSPTPAVGGPIQEINVLAIPVALNLDGKPGPDGFVIKVYAGNPRRPKPVSIQGGSIQVRMFDGIPGLTAPPDSAPRRIWTYSAAELQPYQIESSIGVGYQLALAWGDAKPTQDKISVVVDYELPSGTRLRSAPSIIAVR